MLLTELFVRKVRPKKKREAKEHALRSLTKALSWRILGTLDTFVLAWLITGSAKTGAAIGAVELFTKIFLFYVHERAWAHVSWGRPKLKNPPP